MKDASITLRLATQTYRLNDFVLVTIDNPTAKEPVEAGSRPVVFRGGFQGLPVVVKKQWHANLAKTAVAEAEKDVVLLDMSGSVGIVHFIGASLGLVIYASRLCSPEHRNIKDMIERHGLRLHARAAGRDGRLALFHADRGHRI